MTTILRAIILAGSTLSLSDCGYSTAQACVEHYHDACYLGNLDGKWHQGRGIPISPASMVLMGGFLPSLQPQYRPVTEVPFLPSSSGVITNFNGDARIDGTNIWLETR